MEPPEVDQPTEFQQESPSGERPDLLEELEQRVLSMAAALKEARQARRDADAEANTLREAVQERDMQIAVLKKQLEGDDLRTGVRARVEALIRRVDELEQEG